MTVVHGSRVLLPDGVIEDAVVELAGDRVTAIRGRGGNAVPAITGTWIVPGLVDIHVHGGGGGAFDGGPESARIAARHHHRRGTTSVIASLVSAPVEEMVDSLGVLADLVDEGLLAGIHLEGPFLARERRGAHAEVHLLAPDGRVLDRLLDAGRGHVRHVTLAPELPDALALVARLQERGAVAAVGHTDASAEVTRTAVAAGARLATHLFNAMRPLHHRDPGPVGAALADPRVTCELVGDGVHIADDLVGMLFAVAGPQRLALVTDATAAAGMGDGAHHLGPVPVVVRDGVARVATGDESPGPIAGGTAELLGIVRRAVRCAGVTTVDAVRAATSTPAEALYLADAGRIAAGGRADLLVLDSDLDIVSVVRGGQVLAGRGA